MFVDKVEAKIKAGDGGNGIVSFRHEKFIDRGGPDGGDGGDGGDVILRASRNQNTLAAFRYQRLIKAEPGKPGGKRRKHGKSGKNIVVDIPVGTVVYSPNGEVLADLTEDEQQAVIAKGGKGGFGNAHFTSSRRQTPRVAEKGEKGEEFEVTFELKMLADVGLIGLPNAGKSTLLASISNAKPEIANYPFTTLTPNLGVVDIDNEMSVLVADIPGLIEGASHGKGLGDEFLRHVERNKVLLHLIDAYQEDIGKAYLTIQNELQAYRIDLSGRPQIITINKIDGLDDEIVADKIKQLKALLPPHTPVFAISAQSKQGVDKLLYAVKRMITDELERLAQIEEEKEAELPVITLPDTEGKWNIEKTDDGYIVTGKKIERFAERTDFSNSHGVDRLRDIMRKMGIVHELERLEIEPGDTVHIADKGKISF